MATSRIVDFIPVFEDKGSVINILSSVLSVWSRDEGCEAPVDKISYIHIEPLIQEGPTCGLVALCMVASLLPLGRTVKDLLEDAQAMGYSRSGEMFSADNMATFAKYVLGQYYKVELISGGMSDKKELIIDDLLTNKVLYLVPYDADRNHTPTCLNGHKAHWAVLCGAVNFVGKWFVFARQGKSKHVGMWLFDDLDRSNSNLFEISPCRLSSPTKYIFHDLRESMAGKFIKLGQY